MPPMYSVRLWSVRHSRRMEWLYNTFNPLVVKLLRGVVKVFGRRLDKPITKAEALAKGFFFDCKMCGDCALSRTGMSCPMNCPKTLRNGPCGGVRENGHCEVKPEMRCVWVAAWDGASRMKNGDVIRETNFALDHRLKGQSSWLKMARDD
ncbi:MULTISPECIES: methylenetetrahydrofolate reductase C-terminal domain-containing protein [unclassified Novosphingobium]|uniref:methylenetetrahydrofolate reductase C-terminal domain-containing protein n=1 Tax=unclassified Novosphingobium TaxID=2644732 RepID=UPI0025E394E1|nr:MULTISPECIES: methylenetetrahydrofolate reductase C-terminal domain-containing protein [unclassified Novosphingobium]HQV02005.1 methylenetetrahydrofolate reductase C-terminal domain-containing protein [Novosphingobium sp.]